MPAGNPLQQRVQVLYQGTVQGVGFRYSVNEMAHVLRVTGYVRNLPNGEVELVAEGRPRQLDSLLQDIAESRLSYYIQSSHEIRSGATGEFGDFSIRY